MFTTVFLKSNNLIVCDKQFQTDGARPCGCYLLEIVMSPSIISKVITGNELLCAHVLSVFSFTLHRIFLHGSCSKTESKKFCQEYRQQTVKHV